MEHIKRILWRGRVPQIIGGAVIKNVNGKVYPTDREKKEEEKKEEQRRKEEQLPSLTTMLEDVGMIWWHWRWYYGGS